MAAAKKLEFVSVHDYLEGELNSTIKHEYLGGVVYATYEKFYYPDVSAVCESNPDEDSFQDRPVVIFEVLSRKTQRIDTGEKKDAYLTIPTLQVYALVEQETAAIVVFRRAAEGFLREVHEGMKATLALPEIGIELPLAEVYAGLKLVPEPEGE